MIGLWSLLALSLGWVAFGYVGYPLLARRLARRAPRRIEPADRFPPISVIIAVHDGERSLAAKLEATLALEYPGRREVWVVSDGSNDATDAIADGFAPRGVHRLRLDERGGKEAAQAAAIGVAAGEILVFSDVTAELAPDALVEIVRPFADPRVGCVSSEDEVESEGGEGAYVRLEMALRRWESEAGMLVGCSGSFFAVRRSIAFPWPVDLASDFRSALEAGRLGMLAVSAPGARARFTATDDPAAEWQRKVRTVRRGLAVLAAYRGLLHPRHGRLALALWGHKVARFTQPFALILALLTSAALAPASALAAAAFWAQLAGYALGTLALLYPTWVSTRVTRLLGFFVLVNASMFVAWLHHGSGQRAVAWQPTRR